MFMTDDEKILTDFGPSYLEISDVQRYRPTGLSDMFLFDTQNPVQHDQEFIPNHKKWT